MCSEVQQLIILFIVVINSIILNQLRGWNTSDNSLVFVNTKYCDSVMEFRLYVKVFFFSVAIVFTFFNIKERFFSERVRLFSLKTVNCIISLDDSQVFVKKVIRDWLSNVSHILRQAWIQYFFAAALWFQFGIRSFPRKSHLKKWYDPHLLGKFDSHYSGWARKINIKHSQSIIIFIDSFSILLPFTF